MIRILFLDVSGIKSLLCDPHFKLYVFHNCASPVAILSPLLIILDKFRITERKDNRHNLREKLGRNVGVYRVVASDKESV